MQGTSNPENFGYYDVIIYDQLESPILWIDSSPDSYLKGKSLTIPVGYVKDVIEFKSSFNTQSAKKVVEHLLLSGGNNII